ncbi:hypothetical protein BH11MYX2_BH11MYX2_33990 [soil metagenome]
MLRRALLLFLVGCGSGSSQPAADSGPDVDAGEHDSAVDAPPDDPSIEQGVFVENKGQTGPIEWIPIDSAGLHARVTLAAEIPAAGRHSTWGFSPDGAWLIYVLGQDPTESVWARYRGGAPQRIDDGSRPYWSGLTYTNDRIFFVGESKIAFTATLGADGIVGPSTQVSAPGKSVFSVPIAPSGKHVAMHYYPVPVQRVVQDMSALGTDRSTCCSFGYYWNLSPEWAHQTDRELMVAGPQYADRHLYVAGIDDTTPTPIHIPAQDGGQYVDYADWSADDELIGYLTKMTTANFSDHLWIADVRGTPKRIEVTSAHTNGLGWRPGTNKHQLAYIEYPTYQSQQRLMLGTVTLDPLAFSAVPIVTHAPSDIFSIDYEWNADGTAILHHGGATGDYTVTFVAADGQTTDVPVGRVFRKQDATVDWSIPILSWSKDGRRFVVLSNTGFSVGSIDPATRTLGPVLDLPSDVHFAFFDRRAVAGG